MVRSMTAALDQARCATAWFRANNFVLALLDCGLLPFIGH